METEKTNNKIQETVEETKTTKNNYIKVSLPKLRLNDCCSEVRSLKLLLEGFGYSVSNYTGEFDVQTFESMQRFQKLNHITVNDYCDEKTWKRLLSIP